MDFMQRRMVFCYDVPERPICPIFNCQADLIYTAVKVWDQANMDMDMIYNRGGHNAARASCL
jgi:hypothetical protein